MRQGDGMYCCTYLQMLRMHGQLMVLQPWDHNMYVMASASSFHWSFLSLCCSRLIFSASSN